MSTRVSLGFRLCIRLEVLELWIDSINEFRPPSSLLGKAEHDHVLIQRVLREEGLFTSGPMSVCWCVRERELE